eukprot:m.13083 g.13083  ORF g.13083 m.13083 type:complete len:118 (+) comp10037_c0_seq1:1723-2076(+)
MLTSLATPICFESGPGLLLTCNGCKYNHMSSMGVYIVDDVYEMTSRFNVNIVQENIFTECATDILQIGCYIFCRFLVLSSMTNKYETSWWKPLLSLKNIVKSRKSNSAIVHKDALQV